MNHLPSTQIQRMFGEIAGWYDNLNHLLSLGVDRSWRRKTVRMVPPRDEAGWILDVCTGTADLALAYWKASRRMSAVRVVGADFSRPMLDIGNKKRRLAGAEYTGAYHARGISEIKKQLASLAPVEHVASLYWPLPLFEICAARVG